MAKIVRIARVNGPTDISDVTLGWATFEEGNIPVQGVVLIDDVFYNVMGIIIEVEAGKSKEEPGSSHIALKVVRTGPILAAPAGTLEALKAGNIKVS